MLLKPFLKCIKSVICNSFYFLNKCPRVVDENTEIVTFDVISLYTSIPHEFGLEAIDYLALSVRSTYIQDLKRNLFYISELYT